MGSRVVESYGAVVVYDLCQSGHRTKKFNECGRDADRFDPRFLRDDLEVLDIPLPSTYTLCTRRLGTVQCQWDSNRGVRNSALVFAILLSLTACLNLCRVKLLTKHADKSSKLGTRIA